MAALLAVAALVVAVVWGGGLPGLDDRVARFALPEDAPPDTPWVVSRWLRATALSADVRVAPAEPLGRALELRAPRREIPALTELLVNPPGLVVRARPARCADPGCPPEDELAIGAPTPPARPGEVIALAPTRRGWGRPVAADRAGEARLAAAELTVRRGDGPTLTVTAAPGSRAAALLANGREIVLSDGIHALYTGPSSPTLTLSFGTDVAAYERARRERVLLTLPPLPPFGPPTVSTPPPDVTLATLALTLPPLLSLLYVAFVRRFDRAHPEPLSLVSITFALGGASTLLALGLEVTSRRLTPWLDPRNLTFGGRLEALPLATLGFTITVGLAEEGAKLLATLYASRRREFDEPVDGVVYGAVAALGFAAAENVVYFAFGRVSPALVAGRAVTAVPVHLFLSGLWGYALGARLVRPRQRVAPALALSALGHGAYDAALVTDGGGVVAVGVVLALAVSFVVVLRAALRHGPVSTASASAARGPRARFRLGRPWAFTSLAALLPALALALMKAAASWEAAGASQRSAFLAPVGLLVVAVAATLWGITATLPLDAVVDDHGLTFAGAARAYSAIHAVAVHGAYVDVASPAGDVELGPGSPRTLAALEAAIRARTTGLTRDSGE